MTTEYLHQAPSTRLSAQKRKRASTAAGNLQGWDAAVAEIKAWPGYVPQPLWALERQAERLGLAKLYYKDESQRLAESLVASRR